MYNLGITGYIDFSDAAVSGNNYTFPYNIQDKLSKVNAAWVLNYDGNSFSPCSYGSGELRIFSGTGTAAPHFTVSGNVITKS